MRKCRYTQKKTYVYFHFAAILNQLEQLGSRHFSQNFVQAEVLLWQNDEHYQFFANIGHAQHLVLKNLGNFGDFLEIYIIFLDIDECGRLLHHVHLKIIIFSLPR